MLGKIYIDSLKIKMNFNHVVVLDDDLYSEFAVINVDTGEMSEDIFKKNKVQHNENGIKTSFVIAEWHNRKTGKKHKYLNILVNAKVLKEKYFQGITWEAIEEVYNYIIDLKIIDFDYSDFLESAVVDIDLCYNYKIDIEKFQKQMKYLDTVFKHTDLTDCGKRGFGLNKIGLKGCGFQCSKRETNNFLVRPFMKFYAKGYEMLKSTNEDLRLFYATYFYENKFVDDSLQRLEITIKNKEHLKNYLKNYNDTEVDNKLYLLLDLVKNQKLMSELFIIYYKKHFENSIEDAIIDEEIKEDILKLKGKDKYIFSLIEFLLGTGQGLDVIVGVVSVQLANKQERFRWRALIKKIVRIRKPEKKNLPDYLKGIEFLIND